LKYVLKKKERSAMDYKKTAVLWIPGTTGQREENCATIQTKNKTQQFKQTKPQLRPTSHKKHCSICPNRPTEPQHTRCNRNRPVTARVRKFQTTSLHFL